MFENPRRGRQTRNFARNVPKIRDLKSSSEQIFSENCRWVPLKQLHGTAMGPPVSVAVAEIVMQNIEEHVLAIPYGSGRKFEDMK